VSLINRKPKLMRKNMQCWSLALAAGAVFLAGCSKAAPPPTSQAESEIARLEKHLVDALPQEVATVPQTNVTTVTKLVSPGFRQEAIKAGIALAELARVTESEAAFDGAVAEARKLVMAARSAVHNEHDRNAAVVLTALLAKQKELAFLNLLIRKNPTIQPDAELAAEEDACSLELRAWLEGSGADASELQRGPCLVAARAALSALGR
jgi:hypothetical protein